MARNARVVLNRQKLPLVTLAVADGVEAVLSQIVTAADPPDATPFGEGLVTTGDYGVWVNGKKVAGTAKPPRGSQVSKGGIVGIVGFGFPGRFQEFGTVHHAAQPFLTPAADAVLPNTQDIMAPVVRPALDRIP